MEERRLERYVEKVLEKGDSLYRGPIEIPGGGGCSFTGALEIQ